MGKTPKVYKKSRVTELKDTTTSQNKHPFFLVLSLTLTLLAGFRILKNIKGGRILQE